MAGALAAANQTETIKEEEEDADGLISVGTDSTAKALAKSKGRKNVKKVSIPDKLCKGTVLCLTVDLIK